MYAFTHVIYVMYGCTHGCMWCKYVCNMPACMYVCVDVSMYVCNICINACDVMFVMYGCMHVCMYLCMYVMHSCMHACMYVFV